jgi:hypothetical protein
MSAKIRFVIATIRREMIFRKGGTPSEAPQSDEVTGMWHD